MVLWRKLAFFVGLILLWALIAQRKIWDPTLFPSPLQVAETLGDRLRDHSLLEATAVSLRRVLTGYAISMLIGVPLGILLARVRLLGEAAAGAALVWAE